MNIRKLSNNFTGGVVSKKFHNYKIIIKEKTSVDLLDEYLKIKVWSKHSDGEVYLYSVNGGGNYSLYLEDRFLNFNIDNETKNISAFEGDLDLKSLKIVKLQLPKHIVNAILSLDTNDELIQGSGGYIHFNTSEIYYDKDKKILQIGKIVPNELIYRIFVNGFAQIKKEHLSGLMFTDMEF